jgi:hypothetical protein
MKSMLLLGAAAIALAAATPTLVAAPGDTAPLQLAQAQDRPSPGTAPPAQRRDMGPTPEQREAERMQRLKSAKSATEANVSVDTIMAAEVRNISDQKIGSVKDLVTHDGKIAGLVLARGGVLGMGSDYHQIDIAHVKLTADVKTVVLDLSDDQAKALPKVERKNGKWTQVVEKKAPPKTAPGAPPSRTSPADKVPAPAEKKADPGADRPGKPPANQ